MKLELELNNKNLNYAAEVLRDWCFVGEGLGCYSNFKIRDEFVELEPYNLTIAAHMKKLMYYDDEDQFNIYLYYHPEQDIYLGWFWDGDGTLLIGYDNLWIINTDCKCDYYWRFAENK